MDEKTLALFIIAAHEGYREFVYSDKNGKVVKDPNGGALTIGHGLNLESRGLQWNESIGILANIIEDIINYVDDLPYYQFLNTARRSVIISMIYNLGWNRFEGFVKFNYNLRNFKYKEASEEMLNSKWATQVGNRAKVLSEIMATGKVDFAKIYS